MDRRGPSDLPGPLALVTRWAALAVAAATLLPGCAAGRGSSRPNDGLADALCNAAPGDETQALARALLEGMKPRMELAIQPIEPASPDVTAAWTYEAYMHTQRTSVHASSVRVGVVVDGEPRPVVPLDPRVLAPLIGEAVPAGHWDWVEVPPTCRLDAQPAPDDPLCRAITTLPLINPLTYALWPLFLPGKRHVEQPPSAEDWAQIAPRTMALIEATDRLIPDAPPDTDWTTTSSRRGAAIVDAPWARSSIVVSVSVDAWRCDRRIAIDARLPLEREDQLHAWLAEHRTPRSLDPTAYTELRVRELGATADLQLESSADVQAHLRGEAGVVCACGPVECRCHRAGSAVLQSDGLGPFSWKTPLCCASQDWATQGGACSCSPVGCSRVEQQGVRRCECNAMGGVQDSAWTPVPQCDPIAPERCCAGALGCSCETHRSACAEGEVEVDACRPETVTCAGAPARYKELDGTPGMGVTVPSCAPG